MNTDNNLEQRSRELFDNSVANLDARTRSRLNQARQAALQAAGAKSTHTRFGARWLMPVGSAAALMLVVLTSVQVMRPGRDTLTNGSAVANTVDDVEILTSSDELEMLQNVDFYAWLDTQDDEATASESSEAG